MDGGRLRRPHLLGIYSMSKMHTKTIQKIQKAYIKTYEEDVNIYKDIENSQGTLLLQKCRPLYIFKAATPHPPGLGRSIWSSGAFWSHVGVFCGAR